MRPIEVISTLIAVVALVFALNANFSWFDLGGDGEETTEDAEIEAAALKLLEEARSEAEDSEDDTADSENGDDSAASGDGEEDSEDEESEDGESGDGESSDDGESSNAEESSDREESGDGDESSDPSSSTDPAIVSAELTLFMDGACVASLEDENPYPDVTLGQCSNLPSMCAPLVSAIGGNWIEDFDAPESCEGVSFNKLSYTFPQLGIITCNFEVDTNPYMFMTAWLQSLLNLTNWTSSLETRSEDEVAVGQTIASDDGDCEFLRLG